MEHPKKNFNKKDHIKAQLRLKSKLSRKNKRKGRLILKNLPFTTTEEDLRKHFEAFGVLTEVTVLKRETGEFVGCGFIQFERKTSAAKARHHLNGKPFLNRTLNCDWALPKDKFLKQSEKNEEKEIKIKEEPVDELSASIKEEAEDVEIKDENMAETLKEENQNDNVEMEISDNEENDYDAIENNVEHQDDCYNSDEKNDEVVVDKEEPRPRVISNDVQEGKTVFIQNIPFTATNEDLKECMSQFGPLYYALICMDKLTEHSRGSGFVKFRSNEDAEKCLDNVNVILMGNTLEFQRAMNKNDLQRKSDVRKGNQSKHKDSRNLYLVKEGVILAGTKAAEGVSATDMTKRLQLEQYKTQVLKNLNMFVSKTRLIIHNLPASYDDKNLRKLFAKHADSSAMLKEARVMRNLRNLDSKGVGKSKEFGFVTFTSHDDALNALRSINNNPTVFSANRRPIVSFSIENRTAINAKQKRLHQSRVKNPSSKDYVRVDNEPPKKLDRKHEFEGVLATPGIKKMRSRFNLKAQAQMHKAHLKTEKKKRKQAKRTEPSK